MAGSASARSRPALSWKRSAATVTEPYLATVVIGAALLSSAEASRRSRRSCPDRRRVVVLAFAFRARGAFDLAHVDTSAKRTADGWRLNSHKTAVLDGNAAGQIIVSARLTNDDGTPGKLCLFLVPRVRPVSLRDYSRLGGGRACNLVSLTSAFPPTPCSVMAAIAYRKSKAWWTAHGGARF
jgi:alkylation response protein AidB-like acyl-CoA dehydrogenase